MCPVLTGPSKLGPVPAARGGHLLTNAPSQLLCPHSETRAPEPSSQVCCRAPGGDNTIDESHYEPPMNLGAMLNSPPHGLLPGPLQHAPGPLQRPPAQIPFPRSQWCPRTGHPPAIPESSALTAWEAASIRPKCPCPGADPPSNPADDGSCPPPPSHPQGSPCSSYNLRTTGCRFPQGAHGRQLQVQAARQATPTTQLGDEEFPPDTKRGAGLLVSRR